jgi:aminopeptidase-like protein
MRSKYGEYPEYHTSLDNMDIVTPKGLNDSYIIYKDCIELLERNEKYKVNCCGEPQLGKRGLYPTLSTKKSGDIVRNMMNLITYADGLNDLIDISNIIGVPADVLYPIIEKLCANKLLEVI